jgi:hypothetical protein
MDREAEVLLAAGQPETSTVEEHVFRILRIDGAVLYLVRNSDRLYHLENWRNDERQKKKRRRAKETVLNRNTGAGSPAPVCCLNVPGNEHIPAVPRATDLSPDLWGYLDISGLRERIFRPRMHLHDPILALAVHQHTRLPRVEFEAASLKDEMV